MPVKTIKNVDDETWRKMREISQRKKLKMGGLLRDMVNLYSKNKGDTIRSIIPKKPILTEKEAEDMKRIVKKIRSEYGFRQ